MKSKEAAGDAATEIGRLGVAIVQGEQDAERQLYLRAYPLLVRQIGLWVGVEEAEDIAQEAFMLLLQRLRSGALSEPERTYGYLSAVARNMAKAQRRKQARRATVADTESIEALPAPDADPLSDLQRQARARYAHDLLSELKVDRDREVLNLLWLQDLERNQVCELLSLSPRQLSRVYYRSKARLREVAMGMGEGVVEQLV